MSLVFASAEHGAVESWFVNAPNAQLRKLHSRIAQVNELWRAGRFPITADAMLADGLV
jgi:hypothetical protein